MPRTQVSDVGDPLIFIDTNIFLDFYRQAGSKEPYLSTLGHIDKNHANIITTHQIHMEYMKNRQKVILQSLQSLGRTKSPDIQVPAFLTESKATEMIKRKRRELSERLQGLTNRVERVLRNPSGNDQVYRTLQRLFKSRERYHLHKNNQRFSEIYQDAEQRFLRGSPPRKANDTSYGDAVNWEWIIRCANDSSKDIIIVTRDSDYGVTHNGKTILNDWLKLEFQDRVGRGQKISITDRLTNAFKQLAVQVTPEETAAEETLLETPDAEKLLLAQVVQEFYKYVGRVPSSLLDLALAAHDYAFKISEKDNDSTQ